MSVKLFLASLVGALLTGCAGFPATPSAPPPFIGDGRYAVYVVHHGWHTGLVVRASGLDFLSEDNGWLELGWGDQGFYQAGAINPWLAMSAVAWPTDSVIRVRTLPANPAPFMAGAGVVKLCARPDQLDALLDFLSASFAVDSTGDLIRSSGESPVSGRFYQARGDYVLTRTCNSWVAQALRQMGIELDGVFTATAGSLMHALHELEALDTVRMLDDAPSSPSADAMSCGQRGV